MMRHKLTVFLSVIVVGITALLATAFFSGCSQSGKKVLLIYDLEGVTGATQPMDVSAPSPRYPTIRESLTEDVNSAIKGLQKAGATEIVLTDAHGSGNPEPDYILDKLPNGARFDIPVIFVTGDNVLKEEVVSFSPKTEYVIVKEALSLTEAESRERQDVSSEIEAAAERALRNLGKIPAWNPPELENTFENLYAYLQPRYAALAMDFPGAKAVNNKTVSIRKETFLDAYLTYRLLCNYTATSRFWKLTRLISETEGGPEILQKVSAKMAGKFERSFEPTGDTIDRSELPPRGKHGYQ